uniref:Uncharacterized protein n=1 Tax=Marseillevirus LCMAC201 TaxID=2506605 RepID=A0A481YWK5_9VIRU|nr:MAG: hypothetical protein LCMAC201_00670 [Marseillevirus LCMAC201]
MIEKLTSISEHVVRTNIILDILEDQVSKGKITEYEYIQLANQQMKYFNSLDDGFVENIFQKQIDEYKYYESLA